MKNINQMKLINFCKTMKANAKPRIPIIMLPNLIITYKTPYLETLDALG